MNRQIDKRLNELESLANLTQLPNVIVWPTEIEKKVDRIMARLDSTDFRFGMWG